jgi:hypothetical protein
LRYHQIIVQEMQILQGELPRQARKVDPPAESGVPTRDFPRRLGRRETLPGRLLRSHFDLGGMARRVGSNHLPLAGV